MAIRRQRVAATVASVDSLVWSEEECCPGQVIVEVEYVEVDTAHTDQADEHELAGEVCDLWMKAGNLPVEDITVKSVLTAEDHEQELAALASDKAGLVVVGQPDWRLLVCRPRL